MTFSTIEQPLLSLVAAVGDGSNWVYGAAVDCLNSVVTPVQNFILNVSDIKADAGDTLDVKIQESPDGTNWVDVASPVSLAFTQIAGNAAEPIVEYKRLNGLLGRYLRVAYKLLNSGDSDQQVTLIVTRSCVVANG
jgi:hypothetical protein